jgi:hypothetical protein
VTNGASNLSQSVRRRLLNLSRETGQDYNRLLVRYALERFLYRLGQSEHADRFILKGAMLFAVWSGQQYRATQDLDLLGTGDHSIGELEQVFREIAQTETDHPDAMAFIANSVTAEAIRQDRAYEGVRIRMQSRLGSARLPLIIDIGFGDAVTPSPDETEFPVLLDAPKPKIRSYPRPTLISEKLEAMVVLGNANSRMKDFADIWYLAQHFDFDGPTLCDAISNTFNRRGTQLPVRPVALTEQFAQRPEKQAQWSAFIRRVDPTGVPPEFPEAVAAIAVFLRPVIDHLTGDSRPPQHWQAGDQWLL